MDSKVPQSRASFSVHSNILGPIFAIIEEVHFARVWDDSGDPLALLRKEFGQILLTPFGERVEIRYLLAST
jgi:hypothetical protein